MRTLSLLLFVCFLQSANAATYYFSTNSGDDSRTPAEAQDPSTPWKTLRKLNFFFSSLRPGDAVLLKRGETFYGSITVNKSGTKGSPIVIGAYGTGDKPVITSLVTLSDWVSKGRGIWESYNSSLGSKVNMVVLDGKIQAMGRYPNFSNNGNKGYLTFESHVGNKSIIDNDFPSKADMTGAELVIRSRRWVLERNLITDHSGNKISYKATSRYAPYDNQGYFIQNDIRTLDKFGEWYYNPSANKLSVYFGDNNPSSYDIEAATIGNIISSLKFRNVVFNNLNIKGANAAGFNIRGGSNISIENCNIESSGQNGVKVTSHTDFSIEGCTIYNSNNNGIDLGYNSNNAIIRNNKIINTALLPGMIGSGDGKGIAIYSTGNGNIIEYNEIRNTGYIAIDFNGDHVTVKNNFINNFCTIKDDGAGIYSHIGSGKRRSGRKIIGNIVINGRGAGEGTSNSAYLPAEGIYLDNNASNIEIRDNTIANCNNNGIYIHNAYGMTINNNTIFSNTNQLMVNEDADNSRVRKCIFTNNIFFSKLPSQGVSYIKASAEDIPLFGKFNNNYYSRPLDDRLAIYSSYVNSKGKRVNKDLDLEGWKDEFGHDKGSKKTSIQIEPYKLKKLIGTNKFDNGTFTSGIDGVSETSCKISWSNSGLLNGGYLQVVPESKGSSVYINVGSIKAGKDYILKYSVKGSENGTMLGTFLKQQGGDYKWLTPIQYRKVKVARSDNEMLFSSSTNEKSVSVVFKLDDKKKYYLDNIQLIEADAVITNPDDSIRFEYNATNEKKTIDLNANYIDVKGKKYSNNITLQPYTSVILLRNDKDGDKPSKNEAPTVRITSPDDGKSFSGPANVKISADASDDDGTVSKVEFYNGKTLLSTDDSSPYTYTWEDVPDGNYSITAKATDNDGRETTSDIVKVSVKSSNEIAPVVSLTSPGINTSYSGSATIKISADASDKDGTISKVEFYNGTRLLKTEYEKPYTYSWEDVPKGNYSITAKATDNDGLETTSDVVKVSVGSSNRAPAVSIINPTLDNSFTGPASIRLIADASDKDGTISKVEFYSGSELLKTEYESPYAYTWEDVPRGKYKIMAVATDDNGNVTTSDIVPVLVVASGAGNRPASKNNESSADTTNQVAVNGAAATPGFPDNSLSLKLSPNPARNILNIVTRGLPQNERKTISIVTASGTVIKTIQSAAAANQSVQVDVSSLSNGIYIVKVVSGNKILSQQFVKL